MSQVKDDKNSSRINDKYPYSKTVSVSYADKAHYSQMKVTDLSWVFANITSDVWKKNIEKIRQAADAEEKRRLKQSSLGYFIIGTFKDNKRSIENFINTEFMILDFDHVSENISSFKGRLMKEENVYAAFVSPGGDGMKVIYRFDHPVNDPRLFSSLYKHYSSVMAGRLGQKADATPDASRACFFSYDPGLYVNESAVTLGVNIGFTNMDMPVISKVIQHDESDNLWDGVGEGHRTTRRGKLIGMLLNKEVKQDHATEILLMYNDRCLPPEDKVKIKEEVAYYYKRYGSDKKEDEFWEIKSKEGERYAQISYIKLFSVIEQAGFGKIYRNNSDYLVRVDKNIMDTAVMPQIKDYLRGIVEERKYSVQINSMILEQLICHTGRILSDSSVEFIKTYDSLVKKDSKDKASLYYRNCYVEIDRNGGVSVKDYTTLDRIVWKSQILQRDFKLLEGEQRKSDFEIFLQNVMRGDNERIKSIKSAIGYLIHDYKNPAEGKAVVLCDEKISENPNGRTGKSIIGKAVQKMRKSARVDGKNFKFDRFSFQQIELDTKVIDFNDVNKNFDFEKLFSIVTDELVVEKKNLPSFSLSFDESPKILISTNYTLKGEGASYRARMYDLEFSDYYNERHKPVDDFGKIFFDEWNEEDWLLFDNFMVECVLYFLQNGLVEEVNVNLNKRKFIDNTNSSFVSFIETQSEILNERISKNDFYMKFITEFDDFTRLTKNTFTKWLKTYASYEGLSYREEKSNGKQYFIFSK